MMSNERVVGQHRSRCNDLGTGYNDPTVRFFLHMTADISDLVWGPVAIHRRVDNRVIHEWNALLAEFVPAPGIVLIGSVEVGVGTQGCEERGLVIGRSP